MNKFDERYDIRIANASDINNIMSFIDQYWSKGHILSRDKKLFEYEYAEGDKINFVLAVEKKSKKIEGIFGFLNCSSTKDFKKKDIWGSMWKVIESHENLPFLGVELAKRVVSLTGCRTQIGNGANPSTTVPLRRLFFGDKVVKMQQYYLLNPYIDNYKIAVINNKRNVISVDTEVETALRKFDSIDEVKKYFDIDSIDAIPYKDAWYVNKRYFQHPYYKYIVYGLEDGSGKIGALMMARVIKCNERRILRIVDYIGNQELFAGLSKQFKTLIKDNEYEYIDFYTYGFDEKAILKADFKLRTDKDNNVIPNYFEPFLQKNIDIWAHYKLEGTLFFKADGDQDRPNQFVEIRNGEDYTL